MTDYSASVPFSVSSLGINASAAHPNATVSVSNPQLIPGGTTIVSVTVTAENDSQKVYTITAVRAPAHEDTQAFLEGQREQEIPEPVEKIVEVPVEVEVEVEKIVEVPVGLPTRVTILIGIACLAAGAVLGAVIIPAIRRKKAK